MDTNGAASKTQLLAFSALTQMSVAAAQFSDNPLGDGGPISPTNLETLIITPVNFFAPGIDITTWTGVFLFLSIFGVLSLSNYSFIRTAFMYINEKIDNALTIPDTAFDNWQIAAGLSVLIAYLSTYSIGVLFTFTVSGIAGAGTVVILFFVTLGAGGYVAYEAINNVTQGNQLFPDGGYVDPDSAAARALEDADRRIESAHNEDPQTALEDEKKTLDEIEEVEDHLKDVLDEEQKRITELIQEMEGVVETDSSEQEHLESIQNSLEAISESLSKIEAGEPEDLHFETIGESYQNISKRSSKIANIGDNGYDLIEDIIHDTKNALDDLVEIFDDITKIRADLERAKSINTDLSSGLSEQLSQSLEIDENERKKAAEKAGSLLEMQENLVDTIESDLGNLIAKDHQAAEAIEDKIQTELNEEEDLAQRMDNLSERDDLGDSQQSILRQGSTVVSQSVKRLSEVQEIRKDSDGQLSDIQQKLEQLNERVHN